jgi:hypothetical protein
MANLIDVDAVNKWLFYDSQSGVFYWKESPMYKVKAGIMGVSFCNKYNGYRVKIGRNRTISKAFYFKDFFEACCARKSLENEFNFDKNHGKRG